LYIPAKFKIQKGGREIFDNLIYIYIYIYINYIYIY